MKCTHHYKYPIISICVACHKCEFQRQLFLECQQIHRENFQNIIPLNIFYEKTAQKLNQYKLDATELNTQRKAFQSMLSQTQSKLKNIWDDLSDSIQKIYNLIEQENELNINLLNNNIIAETSYTDLEKLVSIVVGNSIIDRVIERNSKIKLLEKIKNGWNHGFELQKIEFIHKRANWMVIVIVLILYASHKMELLQHLIAKIGQSIYGMQRLVNKFNLQIQNTKILQHNLNYPQTKTSHLQMQRPLSMFSQDPK
ncbi:unnamed protein product [Paramecium sonneborni]|uniref:Uncharacterized protein n=1 Tax=Paramecium sonneborni TaxID=65129 RepID=A0A8S1MWD9_9CILI|nr:unnamed protein product [Paramecium sonneborni]